MVCGLQGARGLVGGLGGVGRILLMIGKCKFPIEIQAIAERTAKNSRGGTSYAKPCIFEVTEPSINFYRGKKCENCPLFRL